MARIKSNVKQSGNPGNHEKLKYTDTGNISLTNCNAMNIPMNCWIHPPDENSTKWSWTAGVFQPRKEHFIDSSAGCCIEADTKKELIPYFPNKLHKPELATYNKAS
jgi:hypothetical protein